LLANQVVFWGTFSEREFQKSLGRFVHSRIWYKEDTIGCDVLRGREPTAIFCVKLIGDSDVKRVEGTVAAFTAAGQLVVLIGNEAVGKFESVESWWRESEDLPETQ
jgi:hypothetical protein